MDDLFEEIECRSKTDSKVMALLRSAMDRAHDDVQSQNGPIEFLHKRSKFYELAAILVDCGLSIVEDQDADILESSREKILSDLVEIKGWLQRRTEEMQVLIMAKDKELVEREENELKLRHALELNEREMVHLQEKLEFERINCQEHDGDICELKNSVDQQVLNIKQKLDEERVSLTRRRRASISCSSHDELYIQLLENNRHSGSELMEIVDHDLANHLLGINLSSSKPNAKQMSSEIDILKGTLDLAFGKMQNAEVFPLEKQWRWSIERDMLLVSVHGFIADTKGRFTKKWDEFIKETRILHDELKGVYTQIMIEEKQMSLSAPPQPLALHRTTSEPSLVEILSKPDQNKDPDPDPSGSNFVARLVKNHEFFIRKQKEQKDPQKKMSSSGSVKKGNKDPDELVSRITKAIKVMDRLIKWDDSKGSDEKNNFSDTRNISDAVKKIIQERDDLELKNILMKEVFFLVLRGSMVELYKSGNIEEECLNSTREEVYKVYLVEKEKELKIEMECKAIDCLVKEEIYKIVVNEAIKEAGELVRYHIEKKEIEGSEASIRGSLKDDIHTVYLREMFLKIKAEQDVLDIYAVSLHKMLHECKAEKSDLDIAILLREDIYALFMAEMMEELEESSAKHSGDSERMKYDEVLHDSSPLELNSIDAIFDEEHSLEMTVKDLETDDHHAQMNRIENDTKTHYASISQSLIEFVQDFGEFEHMVNKRLESNCLRYFAFKCADFRFFSAMECLRCHCIHSLIWHFCTPTITNGNSFRVDKLKHQVHRLSRPASKLRRKKSLYKKAFRIRCQNLSLAENEVDLLGDQVEKLMCLLQNVYLVLHQNSAVLSKYFGVYDIMSVIQTELAKGAPFKA